MSRNQDWSKSRGRELRLDAELRAIQGGPSVPQSPPFHSHDATMQSMFNRGWMSVSQCDINIYTGKAPDIHSSDPHENIRNLRCFLQSQRSH
ncbi:hypothetical protein [Vibrio quintilis]|uniref:Uncharacterized protein n=1 Tax=Vibrio quintilis TaxID=1117707 RepID=A0A1M7Z1E7_9VIBR|nr:hypothetical protein [Vibrio quintilis]SHO58777.1 hypothetical protein VQ7734_04549 [Vibrio quintilis]